MTSRAGRWRTVLLLVVGTGVSLYLTFEHFTGNATLACSAGGAIDCNAVTTSRYSQMFGVPVALLGLVYFVGSWIISWWGRRVSEPTSAAVEGLWYGAGLVFVLYLVWAELVPLGRICLWCTVIHVIVLVMFLRALQRWTEGALGADGTRA